MPATPVAATNGAFLLEDKSVRSVLQSTWLSTIWAAILFAPAQLVFGAEAQGPQNTSAPATLEFPSVWVGGEPSSLDSLRGKAMLLYFFEEECPKCSARWPAIMATAKKYEGEPIFFVAVNSGTSKPSVEQYARTVGVNWPIIVDSDRAFEQTCRVSPISLQNIVQVRHVTPKGQLEVGDWADLDGTIKRALNGARWNFDPKIVPPELYRAWLSIELGRELGRFSDAAAAIKGDRSSRRGDLQDATRKLADYVRDRIHVELEAAKTEAETSKYRAYQHYAAIAEQYAGYAATNEAVKASRELAKDPAVKSDVLSLKLFDKQRPLFDSSKPAIRTKAVTALKKLIDEQPDSEGAKRAQDLLRDH